MNPITTATRDITAFKTLTMNRDHNKGGLALGEGGGLTCVNYHHLRFLANNHTVTPEESDRIRQAFADALRAEYGVKLSALATAQGANGRYARILQRINDRQFSQDGELGLSRATVKATIEEIETALANVNTVPRQIQLCMAGTPLQELLDVDLGPLLDPESHQDPNAANGSVLNEDLLRGAGAMVTELLKTNVVKGEMPHVTGTNPPARKAAIEGNCKFFALILLKFLQGLPDLRNELKTGDDSDGKWNFCKFVRELDRKFSGGRSHWTTAFGNNAGNEVGASARVLLELATNVFRRKLNDLKAKVDKLDPKKQPQEQEVVNAYNRFRSGIQAQGGGNVAFDRMTFEDVFATGNTGEFIKYDVDRLKEFFSLCQAVNVDVNESVEG